MAGIFQSMGNLIPKSVKDAAQRVSSTRIQSYGLFLLIWLCSLTFLIMEIVRAAKTGNWEPSSSIEQIFMALLAHHVVLLGVSKNSKAEPRGDLFRGGAEIDEVEIAENPKTPIPPKKVIVPETPKAPDAPKDPGKVTGKDIEDLI